MLKENRSAFRADEYEEKIDQTLPCREEIYRQIIGLAAAAVSGSPKWLDVGCGTGRMAEMIPGQFKVEQFVFCDESEAMIDIVKSKSFSGIGRKEYMIQPAEELDRQDFFDVVTAVQVNHYAKGEKRLRIMKKGYQALKKDGIYITVDNFAPDTEAGKVLALKRWMKYQTDRGKTPQEAQRHLERYGVSYFPLTLSEQLAAMKSCGFHTVEVFWLSYLQVGMFGIK